jgi:hypothetical protein
MVRQPVHQQLRGDSDPQCGCAKSSATLDGNITFKAKCVSGSDQHQSSTARSNINSTPSVTVLHGTAPPANYCQSVTQLSDPKGLTDAMRQTSGIVTGGLYAGNISFMNYVTMFGVSSNTFPAGSGDTAGYGFPGDNTSTIATNISRDKYVSLQFRAPSNALWDQRAGYYSFAVNPQNTPFSAAIAPCPGQFDSDPLFPISAACKGEALFSDINWEDHIWNHPAANGTRQNVISQCHTRTAHKPIGCASAPAVERRPFLLKKGARAAC